ncbi:MAG: AsnC family protein, partial [Pseudomonadota bacterium]|nr:AsnC family protein [Pseudomonadota bacterium]
MGPKVSDRQPTDQVDLADASNALSPRKVANVDPVDLSILDLLLRNGRASQRRIAREVGMSAPAVADRISRLERA